MTRADDIRKRAAKAAYADVPKTLMCSKCRLVFPRCTPDQFDAHECIGPDAAREDEYHLINREIDPDNKPSPRIAVELVRM